MRFRLENPYLGLVFVFWYAMALPAEKGRNDYRGGTGESSIFLGAAVSHLEGTETSQRAAVWESTGPPPCSRGGIWLYPDEHNQF